MRRGREYWDHEVIDRDFAKMAASGINAVSHSAHHAAAGPADAALRHGLHVMVGLSAEQYVGYLIDKKKDAPQIERLVREKVRAVAGPPSPTRLRHW